MNDDIKTQIEKYTACGICRLFYECDKRKLRVDQAIPGKCDNFIFETFKCPVPDNPKCVEGCTPWEICHTCIKMLWCGGAHPCMAVCSFHSKNTERENKKTEKQNIDTQTFLKYLDKRIENLEKSRFTDGHVFDTDKYNGYLERIKREVR